MRNRNNLIMLLALVCLFAAVSCNGEVDNQLWNNESWIGKVELSNDFRTSDTDASYFNAYTQTQKVLYIKNTNVTRYSGPALVMDLYEDPACTKNTSLKLGLDYDDDEDYVSSSIFWLYGENDEQCWKSKYDILKPTEWNAVKQDMGGHDAIFHFTVKEETKTPFAGENDKFCGSMTLTFKKGVKFDIEITKD